MIVHTMLQGSPEWLAIRCGKLTASDADDMMAAPPKGKDRVSARRSALKHALMVERLTHIVERSYQSADMLRGLELEDEAVLACEALLNRTIRRVGFVEHDTLATGCSPDGVSGLSGDIASLVEIKCPSSKVHLAYWKAGVLPQEYLYQVIHQLWITGASWCDFVSYDPRFPPHLQLFHVAHQRDEQEMIAYELLVRIFLSEVDREVSALMNLTAA